MRNSKLLFVTCLLSVLCWGSLESPAPLLAASDGVALEARQQDAFNAYWYQGQAELTSYALEQARYGEIPQGQAVLIYVTEDFSRKKQVKLDNPGAAGEDRVKVLKLNSTRKFLTGLYQYSMMTSIFSPVDDEADSRALKITTSSQEWCGHTFTQLNRTQKGYLVLGLSYFESEGDETIKLEDALTEDQIWTTIRLDPAQLPIGNLRLIPGTVVQRLKHFPWGVAAATAGLEPVAGSDGLMAYTLSYPDLDRTLTIRFKQAFPHEIEGWEEVYRSGWGSGAARLTTRATRIKRMLNDYWTRNRVVDEALRAELGLE